MTTQSSPRPSFLSPKGLAVVATLLAIPFLSFYWMALSLFIPGVISAAGLHWLTPLSAVPYMPFAFFAYTLFGHVPGYVLCTAACVTIALAGLKRCSRASWRLRVWLLLILCGVVAFPALFHYHPALVAGPGYGLQLATDPGFPGGVIKASQNFVERTPCEYELLGWSADQSLYYRAHCAAETRLWRYSPTRGGSQVQVSNNPAELSSAAVGKNTVLDMVRADGVRPATAEASLRSILLHSQGVASPDGRWVAVVTQHVYGTQDVVVLSRER